MRIRFYARESELKLVCKIWRARQLHATTHLSASMAAIIKPRSWNAHTARYSFKATVRLVSHKVSLRHE